MASPLIALAAFAFAASVTPGPNNAIVAAIAANHGIRAALPAVLGIACGFAAMIAVVTLGIGGTVAALPGLARTLRIVALLWLVWLAWRVARAGAPGSGPARPPLGFIGAAAFQWINPKAWFIALGTAAAWADPQHAAWPQAVRFALLFLVVSLPSLMLWAALGGAARRWLRAPARLRAFNVAMAVLMVAAMLPVAFGV